MRPNQIQQPKLSTEIVSLEGGLNENVSSIEMKAGELISCKNYYITEGSTGGYVSLAGYERYSGKTKPSSVAATATDDTAREAARTAIAQVPGTGAILGVWIYKGKVYAFRNKVGGLTAGMYVESAGGWVEIDTSATPLNPGGRYSFMNYNYSGSSFSESMYWTNGTDQAAYYDGTSVTQITTGMATDTPLFLAAHGDRLFLAFTGGSLQYSNVGDPTDWSAGTGEIGVGFEITALAGSVGDTLIIFGKSNIKILQGSDVSTWVFKSFSDAIGAYSYTVEKLFDTLIFMSDMGVTTLSAAQEFGDFASNAISEKVKRTLLTNKDLVCCATVVRSLNQYRLFFSNGKGIVFSFLNKKLRGATLLAYPIGINITAEGRATDNTPMNFFSSATGYVYQMDSGTSFDGAVISCSLSTAFYHYRSPRYLKRFLRLTFEVYSPDNITLNIRPTFEYAAYDSVKGIAEDLIVMGAGANYGEAVFGTSAWAQGGKTGRVFFDLLGIGSNMSIGIIHTNKYTGQHIIQNFITDYIFAGRQM